MVTVGGFMSYRWWFCQASRTAGKCETQPCAFCHPQKGKSLSPCRLLFQIFPWPAFDTASPAPAGREPGLGCFPQSRGMQPYLGAVRGQRGASARTRLGRPVQNSSSCGCSWISGGGGGKASPCVLGVAARTEPARNTAFNFLRGRERDINREWFSAQGNYKSFLKHKVRFQVDLGFCCILEEYKNNFPRILQEIFSSGIS